MYPSSKSATRNSEVDPHFVNNYGTSPMARTARQRVNSMQSSTKMCSYSSVINFPLWSQHEVIVCPWLDIAKHSAISTAFMSALIPTIMTDTTKLTNRQLSCECWELDNCGNFGHQNAETILRTSFSLWVMGNHHTPYKLLNFSLPSRISAAVHPPCPFLPHQCQPCAWISSMPFGEPHCSSSLDCPSHPQRWTTCRLSHSIF